MGKRAQVQGGGASSRCRQGPRWVEGEVKGRPPAYGLFTLHRTRTGKNGFLYILCRTVHSAGTSLGLGPGPGNLAMGSIPNFLVPVLLFPFPIPCSVNVPLVGGKGRVTVVGIAS